MMENLIQQADFYVSQESKTAQVHKVHSPKAKLHTLPFWSSNLNIDNI